MSLGGDVSIGQCQVLEEIGGAVSDTGTAGPQKSLLGPSFWSPVCFHPPLPCCSHSYTILGRVGGCTMLKKVSNPWDSPQPLGRSTALRKVHNSWKGVQPLGRSVTVENVLLLGVWAQPLGKFTTIWEEHSRQEGGQLMGNLSSHTLSFPQRGGPCAFLPNHRAMSPCRPGVSRPWEHSCV